MSKIEKIREILSEHKPELVEKYSVKEIGVFGSYVRGEEKKKSDVDVMVEFEPTASIGLLKFINMENYLSDLLGTKIDLVEKSALKPRIGKHVLKEVVNI